MKTISESDGDRGSVPSEPRVSESCRRHEPERPRCAGYDDEVRARPGWDGERDFEAQYIAEMLSAQGGNVTKTARALGLSRMMLYKKLRDYQLR